MKKEMVKYCKHLGIVLIVFMFSCSKPITYQGHKLYDKMAYNQAIEKYLLVVKKDSVNEELVSRLADSYRLTNQSEEAEFWYSKLVKLPDAKSIHRLYYGQMLMRNGKYDQAYTWIDNYSSNNPDDERANNFIESIDQLNNFFANKSSYTITNLNINSVEDDFSPTIYNDGILFASSRINENFVRYNHAWNDKPFTKIYFSKGKQDQLNSPELFQRSFQTKYHDGAVTFSADGKLMYYTRNNIVNGKVHRSHKDLVKLKIFSSSKGESGWKKEKDFPYNSDEFHSAHPTLSEDGKRLYFSSDMKEGYGGMDLYVCEKTSTGWGLPINLGPAINTKGNEIFPYIHENKTLYFASNGHKGLGGLDNYITTLNGDTWKSPVNLGNPVNTKYDDFGITLDKNGKSGYFCSDRPGGKGRDDIYAFTRKSLPLEILVYDEETNHPIQGALVEIIQNISSREGYNTDNDGMVKNEISLDQNFQFKANKDGYQPATASLAKNEYDYENAPVIKIPMVKVPILTLKGTVTAQTDKQPVNGAVVTLTLVIKGTKTTREYVTGPDGKYHFDLEPNAECTITASSENCSSAEEAVSTMNLSGTQTFTVNLGLFCVGDIVKIDNIYYDLDKFYIRQDAAIELNKLLVTMNKYSNLKIELRSHTDSRGSDAYNMRLSDNRAKSAVAYLISKGISNSRMIAKGYGESVLTNHCSNGVKCSKAEHQANRRTEFKILSVD